MKTILELTLVLRRELFVAAAQKLGYTALVVEKDFWVCLGAPGVVRVAWCTAAFHLQGRHVAVEGLTGDPTVFGGRGRVAEP